MGKFRYDSPLQVSVCSVHRVSFPGLVCGRAFVFNPIITPPLFLLQPAVAATSGASLMVNGTFAPVPSVFPGCARPQVRGEHPTTTRTRGHSLRNCYESEVSCIPCFIASMNVLLLLLRVEKVT